MKPVIIITRLCILLFCFACTKSNMQAQKNNYKGAAKYSQPSISILPAADEYDIQKKLPDSVKVKLNAFVDEILNAKQVTGITAALLTPKGMWATSQGFLSKPANKTVDSSSVFYWASVGKMVTGVIIQKLINEQKLSLSDKLSRWYPAFQQSNNITVEHLLTHTNGIYSFNSDSAFHFSTAYYVPDSLLAIALQQPNLFMPGEYWAYSNTGYLLLALIAEKIEQKPFSEIVKEKIAAPYHLLSLKALSPREMPFNLALQHKDGIVKPMEFSTPLGAGNIVCNAKDMALLLYLVLTGKILPKQTVYDMLKDLYPMFNSTFQFYGQGIMLYDFSLDNKPFGRWIGHAGGTENYKAIVLYDEKSKTFAAVSINQNAPAEAVALKLLTIIQ